MMLLDLDSEMRALQSQEVRTHKDVLKHYTARYSSFTAPNYPLDAPLPAFALAQHGFHFEQHTRLIKCVTCGYTSADLYEELLLSFLYKHMRASPQCEQAQTSMRAILSSDADDHGSRVDDEAMSESSSSSNAASTSSKRSTASSLTTRMAVEMGKAQFASEEARIKSFENEKLTIGVAKLAAAGLYRVPKQDILSGKDKPGMCFRIETTYSTLNLRFNI